MIVAAGLTPSWQQIMRFARVRAAEVNRAQEVVACASGKMVNVALALSHLHADCHLVVPLGGMAGAAMQQELAQRRIAHSIVRVASPTRTCITVLDDEAQVATELIENAAPLSADELQQFGAALEHAAASAQALVFSGSLPVGTDAGLVGRWLAKIACPCIVDVQAAALLAAASQRPLVLKPNRTELASAFGCDPANDAAVEAAIARLLDAGAQWVVMSDGPRPVWASSANGRFRLSVPPVQVVNPIGCGDCLAAGLAWGVSRGATVLEAIRMGVATAVENTQTLLAGRLDLGKVERRISSIDVVEI